MNLTHFLLPAGRRHALTVTALCSLAALAFPARAAAQNAPSASARATRPDVAEFRARVDAALGESHAAKAYWGILVADRDTGQTLFELNADHFFEPASNAKLVTTALALATLGRDYRFRTTLESDAAIGDCGATSAAATSPCEGHLPGDLILVGRGDPDLSNRKFPFAVREEHDGPVDKILAELADAVVAGGLRDVAGDIVADDSYFPYDPYPAGWSVGDLFFDFGPPVSAIAFNDNTFSIEVHPGARAGDPAILTVEPAAAADTFGNEIVTGEAGSKADFAVVRQPGLNFILVRGSIPLGGAPARLDFAMTSPAETAALDLMQLLEARGVHVSGTARARHAPPPITTAAGEPVLPPPTSAATVVNPHVLAEHLSPPLLESISATNKASLNLHAEIYLRTVGRAKFGAGSTAAGLKVERDFLSSAGIAPGDIVLSDGSGLAPDDLVTPRAIVALLRYAAHQPWGADFLSTLPVAGVDGTLEGRMKDSPAAGMIQAKTGAIEHVHALSGYATTRRGEYLVFSIFCNDDTEKGSDATAPLDAIATAMVETLGPAPRVVPIGKAASKKK